MSKKTKVVFLDRDGVVNEYPGRGAYVRNWKEFKFISGSLAAMKKLNENDFVLSIISNQSGVAKGLYTQKDLDEIDRRMLRSFKKEGIVVRGIYYCIHGPTDNCDCRKPKIGLLNKAVLEAELKPDFSFFIGDSFVDMNTARAFGAKSVLVLSGREKIVDRPNWEFEPDYIFDNLLLAAHYLSAHYGKDSNYLC